MKTEIPTPEEVYDGSRNSIVESILDDLIPFLPGPEESVDVPVGLGVLATYPDWFRKQSTEEVQRLLILRGWKARIYLNQNEDDESEW